MKKIIILILAILVSVMLVSCGNNENGGETVTVADNTEHFDTITKTLKLSKTYTEESSFLTDGIGIGVVEAYTDGDTTRFLLKSTGESIAVRYYAVDTPESTGSVEKWGKAASNFTKNQLKGASEVVLQATKDRAEHDSYGTRYLAYVWYRESSDVDFKCLNLELVENGYSYNKGMNTSDYPYDSYFQKAEDFARKIKLRLHSSLGDPLFSSDPVDMTIHEFLANPEAFYNVETESGSKVKFTAYLAKLSESHSGTITFIGSELFEGKIYSLNIYGNYTSKPESQMPLGHLYEVVGIVGKYNGAYQITDINYSPIFKSTTHITQYDYFVTFNSSVKYIDQYSDTLYSDITVTEVSVEGDTYVVKGTANQNSVRGYLETALELTLIVPKTVSGSDHIQVGSKLACQAYQFVANSKEFTLLANSSLSIK